ncbi:MAG: prolipoprotein diacylglyceryl transferase [Syntrophomonadaceae bacterium]|nr:prolipoprotein diacylglyceryl transferase [Syntrophomonadaceae bacterium]
MFLYEPNPVAFTVLGQDIRWYGICIAFGMLAGLLIAYYRAPGHQIPSEKVVDLALISIPAGVIGARLYYVLFNWELYEGDFFQIINLRNGGLAIHGGLLLGMLAAAIFCRVWKIAPLNLLDLMVPSIALAQAIGRWGNYFNQEAHGGPTDLPWAILVRGEMVQPTILYESLWLLSMFFVLIFIDNRSKYNGRAFLLYGILYSVERFFVEQLRTDSLMIGSFRTAQLVSAVVFIVFLLLLIKMERKYNRKGRLFY